jgi:hypothetical protein
MSDSRVIIKRGIRRLRCGINTICNNLYLDFPRRKPTVLVTSSGRSGSTWIEEVISVSDKFRIMFEPFHKYETAGLEHWEYRQYLERENRSEAFLRDAKRVLEGRVRSKWIDQDNRVFFSNRRLIKDIRTNLCVAWMKQQFPDLKVIYLIRHPFSVALSRMKLGWEADLGLMTSQSELMAKHFPNDAAFFQSITDPFLQHVAFWVIENLVPLRELEDGDALPIAYEDVQRDPTREFSRVFEWLDLEVPQGIDLLAKKPSRTVQPEQTKGRFELSESQVQMGVDLLVRFKMDSIYTSDAQASPNFANFNPLSVFNTYSS